MALNGSNGRKDAGVVNVDEWHRNHRKQDSAGVVKRSARSEDNREELQGGFNFYKWDQQGDRELLVQELLMQEQRILAEVEFRVTWTYKGAMEGSRAAEMAFHHEVLMWIGSECVVLGSGIVVVPAVHCNVWRGDSGAGATLRKHASQLWGMQVIQGLLRMNKVGDVDVRMVGVMGEYTNSVDLAGVIVGGKGVGSCGIVQQGVGKQVTLVGYGM